MNTGLCLCLCHAGGFCNGCACNLTKVQKQYQMPQTSTNELQFMELQKSYVALLNQCADLSMQIKMMKSSLREFEKQKVEPLKLRIIELERLLGFKHVENQGNEINGVQCGFCAGIKFKVRITSNNIIKLLCDCGKIKDIQGAISIAEQVHNNTSVSRSFDAMGEKG